MLDMGFEKDVRSIIAATPSGRKTVMFTATWPDGVRAYMSPFVYKPPVTVYAYTSEELQSLSF